MIKFLQLIFLLSLSAKAQDRKMRNIFTQEFHYGENELYTNSIGDIIFFSEVYSSEKIEMGDFSVNDSIKVNKLKLKPDKYKYCLRRIYSKDMLEGMFVPTRYSLLSNNNRQDYNLVNFKKLDVQNLHSYQCDKVKYENLCLINTFRETAAIISVKEDNNEKKYVLKLIDEDCKILREEEYLKKHFEYNADQNFLCLKYEDYLIFVFDNAK